MCGCNICYRLFYMLFENLKLIVFKKQIHSGIPNLFALNAVFIFAVDIISAIEFDKSGDHLATGDRGGRVVLFERTDRKDVCLLSSGSLVNLNLVEYVVLISAATNAMFSGVLLVHCSGWRKPKGPREDRLSN